MGKSILTILIKLKLNKMGFTKKDNIYKITRMTGNRENILGVSFANKHSIENKIEVIEWNFSNIDNSKIRTSKKEVLNQGLSGLNSINQALETNYTLSKIYYVPSEDGSS
jgi:ribosomal protein L18E